MLRVTVTRRPAAALQQEVLPSSASHNSVDGTGHYPLSATGLNSPLLTVFFALSQNYLTSFLENPAWIVRRGFLFPAQLKIQEE
ncbi:hypothetical protein QSV34_09560 [Porticoccus sp. W117]|uniref:hypothetical protein n=1 Tax=Porticoccus sp. W117 TaxID=3054777 RepID=UPI0025926E54|nr:hypothetical protein [Porticoccus sp. W117]MDM3871601.1 hypothetical protein [Porticoccus sp. W117]